MMGLPYANIRFVVAAEAGLTAGLRARCHQGLAVHMRTPRAPAQGSSRTSRWATTTFVIAAALRP